MSHRPETTQTTNVLKYPSMSWQKTFKILWVFQDWREKHPGAGLPDSASVMVWEETADEDCSILKCRLLTEYLHSNDEENGLGFSLWKKMRIKLHSE